MTPKLPPDPRTERTLPPPGAAREEDSPPGQYRALPARTLTGEPIARIALRAPPVAVSPQEEMLRALAATEGRMLAEISDRREEEEKRQASQLEAFEEQMRRELQKLVVRELKSLPPPPPKRGFEWGHLQYVAAFIVALTSLLALVLNAQKPSSEILKRFDAVAAAQAEIDQRLAKHETAESALRAGDRLKDYEYQLSVRSWVTDVLERAASVKIDDPPGTPAREQLRFYPAPRIDPHKVTDTHIVQPRDPYPVPPPP